jgi:hypothetical protein
MHQYPEENMSEAKTPWQRPEIDPVDPETQETDPNTDPKHILDRFWDRLLSLGLGESALRIATAVTTLILVLLVIWVMEIGRAHV